MEELGWKRILITFNSSQLLSGADGQADPVQDGDLWPRPAAAEDSVWHPSGGPAGAEWDISAGESQSCRPMSGDVTADYTRWNLPTWQVVSCVMDGRDERFSCLQLVYLNVLNKYGFNHLESSRLMMWEGPRTFPHVQLSCWSAPLQFRSGSFGTSEFVQQIKKSHFLHINIISPSTLFWMG